MTPEELQNYITQYNSAMTPGGSEPGMNNYLNSPNYQATYGSNANQLINNTATVAPLSQPQLSFNDFVNNNDAYKVQYGNNNAASPLERFQNDPGMQMAIQAGLPMLANQYASKGLGASGAGAKGLTQYMYNNYNDFIGNQGALYNQERNSNMALNQFNAGIAQNNIQNRFSMQDRLSGNFNNYQGQLANAASLGAQASGQLGQSANTNSQNLVSLLAQLYGQTGQNLSQNNMSVGSDITSLLANLGVFQGNAYLNTGAGMANNMLAGSQLGAQLANAQNASNAQTQSSLLKGYGAMNGTSYGINNLYSNGNVSTSGNPMRPFGGIM